MTFDFEHEDNAADQPPAEPDLSPDLWQMLRDNEAAWRFYSSLAPSQCKLYTRWVMSARQKITRQRRMTELVETLAQGKKLGLK